MKLILLTSLILIGVSSAVLGAARAPEETVVRLKATHGRENGCADYLGLSLMIERREVADISRLKWVGEVVFGPKEGGTRDEFQYDGSWFKWDKIYPSLIQFRYAFPEATPASEQEQRLGGFRAVSVSWMYTKEESRQRTTVAWREAWLRSSLFEWDAPLLDSPEAVIGFFKNSKDRFRYTLAGFSCKSNVINCCQFSCIGLRDLGINIETSTHIRSYINNDYGIYGLWGINYFPFIVTGGKKGSFRPEQVVEEIVRHSPTINPRVVVFETPNAINPGSITLEKNTLLEGLLEENHGEFRVPSRLDAGTPKLRISKYSM